MNNLLDLSDDKNQLFIASVIAVLCENGPIKLNLKDIEKYWNGDIQRLQYDLFANTNVKEGTITFSLKESK